MKDISTEEARDRNTLAAFVESLNPLVQEFLTTDPHNKARSLNPTRFLCRSEVRKFLLKHAADTRSHKFTRVSEETLRLLNERVRVAMTEHIRTLPSAGKTI